jgi:hypothetical protein
LGRLRGIDLFKPPGIAEGLDWARALLALGTVEIDETSLDLTLGSILKYREDQQRVRGEGLVKVLGA